LKIHIKSSLIFLLITMILLVGVTAISATDVDNTQTQEIIEHTEVSTTSYEPVSKDVQAETVKTDNNLNEEEKTIEKVNNTKTNTNTITKSPTIQSSNEDVKTYSQGNYNWPDSQVIFVTRTQHTASYNYVTNTTNPGYGTNPQDQYNMGDGSRNHPTDIYDAINMVTPTRNVIVLLADKVNGQNVETVYETRANAPWVDSQGTYHPRNGATAFTIFGEDGVVWSGLEKNTNMFSLSPMYNATLINIVFRNGNASGIDRSQAGSGPTATHGGAIDNRGNLTVINCTFENIEANENGGAIANYNQAKMVAPAVESAEAPAVSEEKTEEQA